MRRRAGWIGLSLSRVTSRVSGRWLGPASIYCLSDRGKSLLDPGHLPGVEPGHPRRWAGPPGPEEITPGASRGASGRTPGPPGVPRPSGVHPGRPGVGPTG